MFPVSVSAALAAIPLALFVVRILSPALVFLSTLSLVAARPPSVPQSPSSITSVVVATRVPRRALILAFLSLTGLTYLSDGLTFVVYAVLHKTWPHHTGIEINAVIGLAAFSGLAALGALKDVQGVEIWSFKRVKAVIATALVFDLSIVGLLVASLYLSTHSRQPWTWPIESLLHIAFPAFRILLLLPLLVALLSPRVVYTPIHSDDVIETAPTPSTFLLPPGSGALSSTGLSPVAGLSSDASKYGTFQSIHRSTFPHSVPPTRPASPDAKTKVTKPDVNLDPSWSEIWRRIRRISPYLWPSGSLPLQGLAALCVIIVLIGRFVMFALPFTLGRVIRIFEEGSKVSPWPYLFGYVALRFLQGSGGLSALRDTLWAPVMQFSDREMSQLSFNHLLNLSFAFHTRRKTGEILRILDRGAAINRTLELILFNIVPTFIDIIVALVVFCFAFEWILAAVIFVVMFLYVAASVVLTTWRTKLRREMNERDSATRSIHTDCLLNYETVKYFGGEEHEGARYREALREYQALEYKVTISLNLLNLIQNFIITLGLLIGSMIVAHRVTVGTSKPSDFVIFITYLAQLYGPLNALGYIYRSVNQALVDAEKLLKLLNEPTEVNDKPDAPDLIVNEGEVEFENVSFSYDDRTTALNGVSFKVPKGSSVALVGESGAGKSTILRLLYRFYDLKEGEGRILIDGKDIRDVTQASLRRAIGVVPQDSVLFNTSIGYNIGYGKFGASQEEIEAAAKSAQMHERILSFPDGYNTKVGERGVRLSGGEKQRVAIARTLLKNPPILLLDEATSALDTSTEKDIQKALQNLVKGRSSLSIAHRLSTISSADLILVLKDGQIVEQGSHRELLAMNGVFATMWADQISTSGDSIADDNAKNEVTGYSIGEADSGLVVDEVVAEEASTQAAVHVQEETSGSVAPVTLVATPEAITEPLPPTEDVPIPAEPVAAIDLTSDVSPSVGFPSATPEHIQVAPRPTGSVPIPLAFPTSHNSSSQNDLPGTPLSLAQSPGVTFGNIDASPRSGTPDPDSEPKRKRISSQNFQRLAKRISITTKRQGSTSSIISNIPGLKRDNSPRVSTDEGSGSLRGEGSRLVNDSPASSMKDDTDPTKTKKKDKKEKKDKKKK